MDSDQANQYGLSKEIMNETIQILQELVRIDTTNPPGNEIRAAEWIHNYLAKEGIDSEVIESAPGRGNVISRLKGQGAGPSLLLLSHIDVVPSQDVEKWEVPPFSGELKKDSTGDLYVWGRGSLDTKCATAEQLMTYLRLYREGIKPKGDIVFAATADEESGGHFGAGWLVQNKFETIRADNVITEGGGQLLPIKTKTPNYDIQLSEKGIFWTRVKTRGSAGHGSMPGPAKNMAIIKMMKVIDKISRYKPPIIIQDIFRETVAAMDLPAPWLSKRIFTSKWLMKLGVWLAKKVMKQEVEEILYPLVQNKITPTVLRAGQKENNIPGLCEATLDVRLLTGFDRDDLYKILKKILGKLYNEVELEPIEDQPGGYTPSKTEFYQKIEQTISHLDPNAKLVPMLSPGSTDMLHFRNKGMQAYGFVPMKLGKLTAKEFEALAHGYNERFSVDNLMLGTRFFYDLCLIY
ncbi:MAG: M20/M25/M40 family metallo-hydrolase [Candidatus Helarchaeota archaeon]|nr:M20/M25/M40 family metallo-hydrolase [Candidatus Helarchaeota archaeon]